MDRATRDRIVGRLHENPGLDGVPFEVAEDDEGLHLELDGGRLATSPADLERRRAERAVPKRRYGIALLEADEFDEAAPEEIETWLYYAAGFEDSVAPIVDWETRQYEARLPDAAAIVTERVRDRLASPFTGYADAGSAVVEALAVGVERVTTTRDSTWSGPGRTAPARRSSGPPSTGPSRANGPSARPCWRSPIGSTSRTTTRSRGGGVLPSSGGPVTGSSPRAATRRTHTFMLVSPEPAENTGPDPRNRRLP